jgi:hypothetical protein
MTESIEAPAATANAYAFSTGALVIAARTQDAGDAAEALALAGIRTAAQVDFTAAAEQLGEEGIDVIAIDSLGAPAVLLETVFARADATARRCGASIVAAITPDQIDAAAMHLLGAHTQILCEPSFAERVSAFALAKGRVQARYTGAVPVNDATREGENARLQRLNEEVARIADTLTRLTRGEEIEPRGGVRDPGMSYRGPEGPEPPEANAQEIRAVIRARRLRAQFFAGELFADPAWDMLLDLFAAWLEQRQVSVSSLCIAAAVPPTTALRWIGTLHDAGLFERQADPSDRRRAYIALSAKGIDGMRNFIAAAKRQGLSLV